ncbi:hypothetical protein DC918_RS23615 [Vibrio parahaemolyticus]|nr:hypothetical protein [Vibrio parahaemolyticus]
MGSRENVREMLINIINTASSLLATYKTIILDISINGILDKTISLIALFIVILLSSRCFGIPCVKPKSKIKDIITALERIVAKYPYPERPNESIIIGIIKSGNAILTKLESKL